MIFKIKTNLSSKFFEHYMWANHPVFEFTTTIIAFLSVVAIPIGLLLWMFWLPWAWKMSLTGLIIWFCTSLVYKIGAEYFVNNKK